MPRFEILFACACEPAVPVKSTVASCAVAPRTTCNTNPPGRFDFVTFPLATRSSPFVALNDLLTSVSVVPLMAPLLATVSVNSVAA